MKILTGFIVIFFFAGTVVHAQSAILVTGGTAGGNEGSVSYSAGQVAYTTITGSAGSVAQGVQQPYVVTVETGFEEVNVADPGITAYPNPVTDFLFLNIDDYDQVGQLSYQLISINGKLLESKEVLSDQTKIFLGYLQPATYFLKVTKGIREVKTFKILKTR